MMKKIALIAAVASLPLATACQTMDDDMAGMDADMNTSAQTSTRASTTAAPAGTATTRTGASASARTEMKMVGGAQMMANQNIVANASKASNLTTLVSAVKAADLVATLQGPGPFTVFAPNNAAFDRLPSGAVQQLMQPENKAQLQTLLKYHVVAGKAYTAQELMSLIKANPNGVATLNTVAGGTLRLKMDGGLIAITDAKGNVSYVTPENDVRQSNGIVHVVNGVLLPAT